MKIKLDKLQSFFHKKKFLFFSDKFIELIDMKQVFKKEADILFMDIETVPISYEFIELNEKMQKLWEKKTEYQRKEITPENYWKEKGGIMAEFGKIVVVGLGFYFYKEKKIRIKSIVSRSDDEKKLLLECKNQLENLEQHTKKLNKPPFLLCGHNSFEFDFPYTCRRFLVNGISLPSCFDIQALKPWALDRHLDTMQMWKFGDEKNYTSLDLLACIFGLKSSKTDIDGSQIRTIYYSEDQDRLERLADYCKRDVLLTAQVYHKLLGKNILLEEQIEYKEDIYL